jgi:hypothetical protein
MENDKENLKINKEWVNQKLGFILLLLKDDLNKTRKPFFPTRDFYNKKNIDGFDISKMADGILIYLGEPKNNLCVFFSEMRSDLPGFFSYDSQREYIYINRKYSKQPYALGAILAHEMMHLFLLRRKISFENTRENELLTDLSTIYMGLGILIINGMSYEGSWFLSILGLFAGVIYSREKKLSFGYFDPSDYSKYLNDYFKVNKIDLSRVAKHIYPKAYWYMDDLPILPRMENDAVFYKKARLKYFLNILKIIIIILVAFIVLGS